MESIHLWTIIDMRDPQSVLREVHKIVQGIDPDFDFELVDHVFDDVLKLFAGNYPGYRACNTGFHDRQHTTDIFLATARLMHGAALAGETLSTDGIGEGLIAALFHDIGYIQTEDDTEGTGAKYTADHVERGIDFMTVYFREHGLDEGEIAAISNMILATDLKVQIDRIEFVRPEAETVARLLAAADLLGQMADRTYPEKLLSLYEEFREGAVPGYESELDLLQKTIRFYDFSLQRLRELVPAYSRYMIQHFQARWHMTEDFYAEAVQANMEFLVYVTEKHHDDYREYLRFRSQQW